MLQVMFSSSKFVGTVFVSSSFNLASAAIVSSQVNNESSIILQLGKYFPFLQLRVAGFQI